MKPDFKVLTFLLNRWVFFVIGIIVGNILIRMLLR